MQSADRPRPFRPPFYLRNALLQTFLGSNRPVKSRIAPLLAAARPVVLECGGGVRLAGAISEVSKVRARGLVILLHGWEGGISSVYVTTVGQHLFHCGYHIFRLNFRDHGHTQHLNQGLFYGTLIEEVHSAVIQAARIAGPLPVFLCGFSLGGNFALRIGRKWSLSPPSGIDLRHIAAVSPVLNPANATDAIDRRPLIRRYFIQKWRRSLRRKMRLFPERYDFDEIISLNSIRLMTERLLDRYSPYSSAEDYFAGYTLRSEDIEALRIPATLVTSSDDPILPVSDFQALSAGPSTRVIIHSFGGHNGFIRNLGGHTWYQSYLQKVFDASAG